MIIKLKGRIKDGKIILVKGKITMTATKDNSN
jgi:hypothetical protein